MLDQPIATFDRLRVEFETKDGKVVGVEDVSFDIKPGETVRLRPRANRAHLFDGATGMRL